MDRREFLGMASVGAVVAVVVGRAALMSGGSSASTHSNARYQLSDAQWRAKLSPEAYRVLRESHTETPFSSPLVSEHRAGGFSCAGCDQPAFASNTKYDSRTGWPSFWDHMPGAITRRPDFKMAQMRTDIRCSNCDGHLGHVFTDGPQPTGMRYCMNGIALTFHAAAA